MLWHKRNLFAFYLFLFIMLILNAFHKELNVSGESSAPEPIFLRGLDPDLVFLSGVGSEPKGNLLPDP